MDLGTDIEINSLNDHELLIDRHDLLQKYSFKPKMELQITPFFLNGIPAIKIIGLNRKFVDETDRSISVCDNPEKMFINFGLEPISKITYVPSQEIEVKYSLRRIVIRFLPIIDTEIQKSILAEGIAKIDFKTTGQQWKKQNVCDGSTFPAFFQALIKNQYILKDMAFNMAGTFGNMRNRVKELKSETYNICTMIYTSDNWNSETLKKYLNRQDVYSQVKDGLIVIARDPDTSQYQVVGMITHGKKTAFKILRGIFEQAIYIEVEDVRDTQKNQYLVSASYLFPYTNEYDPNDDVELIIQKVVALAKKMEKSWSGKNEQ